MIKLETPYMVESSESDRNKWFEEIKQYFRDNPEQKHYYIHCGNALIFAHNDCGYVDFMDCDVKRTAFATIDDIINEVR
jgi:hypothetical protein